MRHLPLVLRALAAPTLLLSLAPAVRAADDDVRSKVEAYMDAAVRHAHFSGSILIARDGKPVVMRGYGQANRELEVPNTAATKYRLGSITKQFTAICVLILEERGKLKVDDPVSKYVDDAPEAWEKVTIHHLLSHTSGIPSFTSFPDYVAKEPLPSPPAETIKRFRDKPLEFAPGEKFAYSNSGYVLLGFIIEKVAGKSYEAFLKEAIFDPLGMNDTGYDHSEVILKNRAAGYQLEGDSVRNAGFLDMTIPHAAGALYSAVGDFIAWDRALASEVLVPKASLDRMFTPVKGDYGYGMTMFKRFGRKAMGHGGGINGFQTDFVRYPDERVCIAVFCNLMGANPDKVTRDLAAMVFGEPYEIPHERQVASVDPKVFDAYCGRYELSPELIITITREGDRLMGQATKQPKAQLFPESETKFFLKVVDAQVTFVKDDAGKVTHLILHQGGHEQKAKRIE